MLYHTLTLLMFISLNILKHFVFRHEIEIENLKKITDVDDNVGEGTFGICSKQHYRGFMVAVKQYEGRTSKSDVEKEAMMINSFDHPGIRVFS